MSATLIALSIVLAWISGVGAADTSHRAANGSAWLLVIAVVCGFSAWVLR